MQDAELLGAYAGQGDESAFSELVRRYVDLVYSTALRHVSGESSLAEEITQTVFLLAARKANTLLTHPSVAGWLHQTTCHVASRTQRSEARRRARERQAAQMNIHDSHASENDRMLPLLEDAIQDLKESDRAALLLRFFMEQPMQEVGRALGVSEAAAKMRVGRAVERLREAFVKRGVSCTSAAVALALTGQKLQAAPPGLTAKVLSSVTGAALATAPSWMGALLLMTKTKAIILGCAAALFLAAGIQHLPLHPSARPQSSNPEARSDAAPLPTRQTSVRKLLDRQPPSAFTPAAIAAGRLRAALIAPQPKSSIVWPDDEIIRQVKAFPDPHAAFDLLRAAAANPRELLSDSAHSPQLEYLVTLRAISSMQFLAQTVPEVVPYLWTTFASDDMARKSHAFSTLQTIGFKSDDLGRLVELLPSSIASPAMLRDVPQAIAGLIAADPAAAAPQLSALTELLGGQDAAVRFSAACALAGTQLDQDPRISEILSEKLKGTDVVYVLPTVEALAKAGPKAASFVPALVALAKNTPQDYLRADYLRAVAAIDPSAVDSQPEVAKVVAQDAQARDLAAKFEAESADFNELVAALKFPQHAVAAAVRLQEMGVAANAATPALLKALEGKDEASRDQIMEAISRIDPKLEVQRVDARTVSDAVMHAEISLGDKGNDNDNPVTQFIMDKRKFSTWWTRDELIAVGTRLSAMDRTAYAAFAEKVLEAYPGLRGQLPSR